MLEKLKLVENRFDELNDLIINPEIISDQKKYIQISKEYKEIKKIIEKGSVYKNLISNKSEAQEIISNEKDEEMIEMAKMQLEEAEEKIPSISHSGIFLCPLQPSNPLSCLCHTLYVIRHTHCCCFNECGHDRWSQAAGA